VNCLDGEDRQSVIGSSFSETVTVSNQPADSTNLMYSKHSGSLPDGLTLDSTTGVISGTPTAAGIFTFTLEAGVVLSDGSTVETTRSECTIQIHSCTGGCSYSKGYWKNHPEDFSSDFWVGNADGANSIHVTTATIAGSLLDNKYCVNNPQIPGDYTGKKINQNGNPLNQLYAQITAVRLNLLQLNSCTGNTEMSDALTTADNLLAAFNCFTILADAEQSAKARELAEDFDAFNNGLIGPGHCDTLLPAPVLTPAP